MRTNRASEINRNLAERIQFVIRKEIGKAFIRRAIQNEAVRSFLAVMGRKKQYRLAEIRVVQIRMCYQKLTRKIWNFTAGWTHIQNLGSDYLLFKDGVSNCP